MSLPDKRTDYFAWERNAPCPCGSGAKYKRCCLGDVEAAGSLLRRTAGPAFGATHLTAPLLAGLAAACGLRPQEGERQADPETVGTTVSTVLAAMEDQTGEKASALQTELERLLREDGRLAGLRFPPDEAVTAVEEAVAAHPGRDADETAWSQFMTAALRGLVTDRLAEELVWGFFRGLRRPDLAPEAREAVVWGLLQALATPHIPLGYNFLWRDMLRLTLENHAPAADLLKEIRDREDSDATEPQPQPAGHPGRPR